MEGEINLRKARFSRSGEWLVHPTGRNIGLNKHFIGVNLMMTFEPSGVDERAVTDLAFFAME